MQGISLNTSTYVSKKCGIDVSDDDSSTENVIEDISVNTTCVGVDAGLDVVVTDSYMIGVTINDIISINTEMETTLTITERNDHEYPIYPLYYVIIGSILIVVITFAST